MFVLIKPLLRPNPSPCTAQQLQTQHVLGFTGSKEKDWETEEVWTLNPWQLKDSRSQASREDVARGGDQLKGYFHMHPTNMSLNRQ